MLKRCICILAVLIILAAFFSGCSNMRYKTYYQEIQDYDEVWELSGFHHGYDGSSTFFPAQPDTLDVEEFFCRYDEELPLGEGVQLLLTVRYEQEDYQTEAERIASVAEPCSDSFPQAGCNAYATRLLEDGQSEFALLDEEESTISYIYLFKLPRDQIELNQKYIPDGYTGYGKK